jgi:hypothetical protein
MGAEEVDQNATKQIRPGLSDGPFRDRPQFLGVLRKIDNRVFPACRINS